MRANEGTLVKINEFILVSTVSAKDSQVIGRLIDFELIRHYIKAISDELDNCGIRHRIAKEVGASDFVILCGLGFLPPKSNATANISKIRMFGATAQSLLLATRLAETISHWGRTYVAHEHRQCRPVVATQGEISAVGTGGLYIEPFAMNGPRAVDYAVRLEELGRDIGRCVADYVASGCLGAKRHLAVAEDLPIVAKRTF